MTDKLYYSDSYTIFFRTRIILADFKNFLETLLQKDFSI